MGCATAILLCTISALTAAQEVPGPELPLPALPLARSSDLEREPLGRRVQDQLIASLKSSDPYVRSEAIRVYSRIGRRLGDAVEAAGLAGIESKPVAEIRTLVEKAQQDRMRLPEAVHDVALAGPNWLRREAICALCQVYQPFDVEELRDETWVTQWCGTAEASDAGASAGAMLLRLWEEIPVTLMSLLGENQQVTWALANKTYYSPEWNQAIFDRLPKQTDAEQRVCALLVSAEHVEPWEGRVPELLLDESDLVRERAAAFYFDCQAQVAALLPKFDRLPAPLRRSLVQMSWVHPALISDALYTSRVDLLKKALHDSDDGVRGYALEAMVELGLPVAKGFVIASLESGHRQLRVSAIEALGKWWPADAQLVRRLTADADPLVAKTAMRVIGNQH